MPKILIVAYGNPLRCDDGIAWRAADAMEGKFSGAEVEILRLHQLTPEVADAIRHRKLVLFLDAASIDDIKNARPGEVRVQEVSDENREHDPGQFSHVYSPAKVLDLARELYQAKPKALLITVAGENFEHGESLSPKVAEALPSVVTQMESLVDRFLSAESGQILNGKPRSQSEA